jgi:hypothetical protein
MQGSMTVFINGKPAVRMGDQTRHCGGIGAMIEGSPNVIVGGPPGMGSSGGAGGGGGGGSGGGGAGGGATSSARSAATGGGGAGGSGGGGGSGSSARGSSSAAGAGSAAAAGSAAGRGPAGAAPAANDDGNVHVVAADLKTPGGQPLGLERVVLVKKATGEQVAGPETTDARGHIAFVVDDPGDYEIRVVPDDRTPPRGQIDEDEVTFELHCQFIDDGMPAAGETVHVTGPGTNQAVTLGATGELTLAVGAGEYALTVRKQQFKANAVRVADYAGPHEFQLANELDRAADFEAARANRYSPANRGQR